MSTRAILALLAALLLAVQVIRTAAFSVLARTRPAEAARFWPCDPAVELWLATKEVGSSAAGGRPVPAWVFSLLADASVKEPLAAEPFTIGSIAAEVIGDQPTARRMFEAAHWRNGVSVRQANDRLNQRRVTTTDRPKVTPGV